jgi:hypothetical protein
VSAAQLEAQQFTNELADSFVTDLLNNPEELVKWVQEDELEICKRLGINYFGVQNKFLISYDVSDEMRKRIADGTVQADYQIQQLGGEYSKLSLHFKGEEDSAEYFFEGARLVGPVCYHSRDWQRFETDYFVFIVSDGSLFNTYSARKLDAFVAKTLDVLEVSQALKTKLRKEKIFYFRCKDTDEINNITGYASRGMYILAYDYIVTTFNCHYHEIVHLLVNYKLQDIPPYTHPFLQEGIAVALGGRGGREQPVIMNLGVFLELSEFASYNDLLSYTSFAGTDPSLSYPLCGLYGEFLIKEIGIGKYLALYERFSGENSQADIPENILPPVERWEAHLQSFAGSQQIQVQPIEEATCNPIFMDALAEICQGTAGVHFKIEGVVLFSEAQAPKNYHSSIFKELFPTEHYRGEKYAITANENEISVYNLYTNDLLAKYVPSMSVQKSLIVLKDGRYVFSVNKNVFDEDIRGLKFCATTSGGFPQQ